mmetsp:Transcript_24369/g.52761  ORF Transcript_24369/g.52761 Transcript_24369/m.52761 type:complete len:215 (+) Transcript_24369:293-937(+)
MVLPSKHAEPKSMTFMSDKPPRLGSFFSSGLPAPLAAPVAVAPSAAVVAVPATAVPSTVAIVAPLGDTPTVSTLAASTLATLATLTVATLATLTLATLTLDTLATLGAFDGAGLGMSRMFSGFRSQWITSASSSVTRAATICFVKRCTTARGRPRYWFCVSTSSRDMLSSSKTRQMCPACSKDSSSRTMWRSLCGSCVLFNRRAILISSRPWEW